MDKVSVKLQGGLCNYMFQIACAYAYSLRYDKKLLLTSDDSVVIHNHIKTYQENILNKISFSEEKIGISTIYNESVFEYKEIPFIEGNLYLSGYFQSEKYFKDYKEEIRELFSFPGELSSVYESDKYKHTTCSIHVRRGDYVRQPEHHPTQSMNYYMKAIKQMPKDTLFLIFSDDISWCKANFPDLPEKFKFIEGNSDYEDLRLMVSCDHNIICNSTFSWWAAWLNNNPEKKVVAPKTWFGSAYANWNTDDLYCEKWIIL